jgi:polyhydroxyalkanoate synthase subunit PhaC
MRADQPASAIEDLKYGLTLSGQDPARINRAIGSVMTSAVMHPRHLALALADLAVSQGTVARATAQRWFGATPDPVATPMPGDRRFGDRAWQDNPLLRGILESYLVNSRWWLDLVDSAEVDEPVRRKARFGLGFLIDALAPSNAPWLNPAVWKEAIDTGGLSALRGLSNLTEDLVRNEGRPRQVDTSSFEIGRNLAATPGRVVFRNELIELLAYEPQTEKVFEIPLICSPPWINKYYVMDLAPDRSFIEHAVRSGFRVFCISYRNPDAGMAGLTMDDYLLAGILPATDRVAEITGSPVVNLFALCLGGTLAGITLGYLAAKSQANRIGCVSFTNTLLDFGEPGDLGIFTDEAAVAAMEQKMKRKGYLEASAMAGTFDWLRGNDLVWGYVVSNWYMGKKPPAFDLLAWNADSTNMPATMHSQYLRSCYLENQLAAGEMVINGTPIDLSAVRTPAYVVGAEVDHIAPWRSTYRTTQLLGGENCFTLTSSGHIAGIVNPPGNPKSQYWTRSDCPPDADEWRVGAETHQGTWWEDWVAWASLRSGKSIESSPLASGEPAPGRYVRGQGGPPIPPPKQVRKAAARSNGNATHASPVAEKAHR